MSAGMYRAMLITSIVLAVVLGLALYLDYRQIKESMDRWDPQEVAVLEQISASRRVAD